MQTKRTNARARERERERERERATAVEKNSSILEGKAELRGIKLTKSCRTSKWDQVRAKHVVWVSLSHLSDYHDENEH